MLPKQSMQAKFCASTNGHFLTNKTKYTFLDKCFASTPVTKIMKSSMQHKKGCTHFKKDLFSYISFLFLSLPSLFSFRTHIERCRSSISESSPQQQQQQPATQQIPTTEPIEIEQPSTSTGITSGGFGAPSFDQFFGAACPEPIPETQTRT